MTTIEKTTIRHFWLAIITAIAFVIITNIFDVFSKVSGVSRKVERLEITKMDKDNANEYFNRLSTLLAAQTATWNQYMISNEADKERILETIKTNQEDIKELIKNYQKIRGAQ